ncbi:MAG: hypothetical protein DMF64_10555 [Acidobacteria bacterium]|nr:MAG: hypothetical protein DMF64_10555 [Acidobacteriota bacterium]
MSVAISPALLKEVALILADRTTVLPASGRLAARPCCVLNCGTSCKQEQTHGMLPFLHLKWPEMRPVAHELIARMHEGHARGRFRVPVVDFVRVFAPQADASELANLRARGDLVFTPDAPDGGTFTLAAGARVLCDLHREGLVIRVPARLGGRYTIMARAFRITFTPGAELEGCKRVLLLVCNRLVSVEVTQDHVDVRSHRRIFDLLVEF